SLLVPVIPVNSKPTLIPYTTLFRSEKPAPEAKNLKFLNESQFDEALDMLKNNVAPAVHIYTNNLEKLWNRFIRYYNYIEAAGGRSEEHTSELQSRENLVCRLLLEKK